MQWSVGFLVRLVALSWDLRPGRVEGAVMYSPRWTDDSLSP